MIPIKIWANIMNTIGTISTTFQDSGSVYMCTRDPLQVRLRGVAVTGLSQGAKLIIINTSRSPNISFSNWAFLPWILCLTENWRNWIQVSHTSSSPTPNEVTWRAWGYYPLLKRNLCGEILVYSIESLQLQLLVFLKLKSTVSNLTNDDKTEKCIQA